jgi:hypothetical protein
MRQVPGGRMPTTTWPRSTAWSPPPSAVLQKSDALPWSAIFHRFNRTHGRGDTECKAGVKIAIKANLNNTKDHGTIDRLNSSPHLLLPLVRQLTGPGKVPPSSMTVFDSGAARCLNLPLVLSDWCGSMLHAFWPRAA